MKKILFAFFLTGLALSVRATVSIEFIVGRLTDANNVTMLDGRYVTVISAGADGLFSAPSITAFTTNDDYLVAGFGLDSNSLDPVIAGAFDKALNSLALAAPNFSAGQKLMVRWFPGLVATSYPTGPGNGGSSGPGAGVSYGQYTDVSWLIPSDSASDLFSMVATTLGGSVDPLLGKATLAVPSPIPEPTTFAFLGGLAALGLAAWWRRVRAA